MQSIYRPLLKQAAAITWKFKYLWFFGLFAALFGNSSVFSLMFKNSARAESQGVFWQDFKDFYLNILSQWKPANIGQWLADFNIWTVLLVVIGAAITLFFIWLSVVCQAGLVHGLKQALVGKGNFSDSLTKGRSKFWPVFLLNILEKVIVFILLAGLSAPFAWLFFKFPDNLIWQNLLIVVAFLVWVPLGVILAFLVKYAIIYAVNENQDTASAIKEAWNLFKQNWIASLELAFLLFVIVVAAGLALVILTVVVALPFVMLGMIASYLNSSFLVWTVLVLAIIALLVMLFLYGAMMNVFQTAAWVILFEKIKLGTVYSKALRLAAWFTIPGKTKLAKKTAV